MTEEVNVGGINCNNPPPPPPSPPNGSIVPDGMRDQYINKLAAYCESLFDGTSQFYAANAAIERAVMHRDGLDAAIEQLCGARDAFKTADSQVGTVASLSSMLAYDAVDCSSQSVNLGEAVGSINDAVLELEMLPTDGELQGAIWDRPVVTEALVSAVAAIHRALEWQCHFSQATALATA